MVDFSNVMKIKKQIEKALRSGKLKNAIDGYKKLLIENPNDYVAMNQLADLLVRTSNYKEAFGYYQKIAEYYEKAMSYPKAIAIYRKMYRIDPKNLNIALKLAELYKKSGMEVEAKKIYLEIAENLRYQRKTNEVLEVYQKLADLDRENIDIRINLAHLYEKTEKPDKASHEYRKIAEFYLKKGDKEKALENLKKAVDTFPKNYAAVRELVKILEESSRYNEAIDELEKLLALFPDDLELKRLLGSLYFNIKAYEEAEKIFLEIIKSEEISEKNIDVIKQLVQIRLRDGEYDEAFSIITPVVDKLVEKEEDEKAHELLNIIIADNDSYIPALMKKASIYRKREKKANLISVLNAIYEVYKANKDKEKMIEILEELIRLDPSNFDYRDELAKIRTGKIDKQAEEEKKGPSEDEKLINAHIDQFDKLFNAGMKEEALRNVEYLREMYPHNEVIKKKLLQYYKELNRKDKALSLGKELIRYYESMEDIESAKRIARELIEFAPEDPLLNIYISKEETDIEFSPEGELEVEGISFEGEKLISPDDLSKLDFYINDGYLDEAESFLNQLLEKDPQNTELLARKERIERIKATKDVVDEKKESDDEYIQVESEEEVIVDEVPIEEEVEVNIEESASPVFEEENKDLSSDIIFSEPQEEIFFEEEEKKEEPQILKEELQAEVKKESSSKLDVEEEIFLTEDDVFNELSDEMLSGENVFSGDENYYYELGTVVSQEVATIKEITNKSRKTVSSTIERSLEEVLSQFKEKINETVSEEDYETRFNLGLAYYSMGLLDEAINEFLIAAKDPKWQFSSYVHLGMAFLNKGLHDESEKWLKKALEVKGQSEEDYLGVKYELANLYDIKGEKERAVELLREILKVNPDFRDVKSKIKQLLY